jgi:hypothetical protein
MPQDCILLTMRFGDKLDMLASKSKMNTEL